MNALCHPVSLVVRGENRDTLYEWVDRRKLRKRNCKGRAKGEDMHRAVGTHPPSVLEASRRSLDAR